MTLENSDLKNRYLGDDSTATFDVTFQFDDRTELLVTVLNQIDNSETVQVIDFNYSVNGGNGDVGSITFLAGSIPLFSTVITISRNMPYSQEVELEENDPLPAKIIEQQIADRIVMMIQQLAEAQDRTVKLQITTSLSTAPTIAEPVSNCVLMYDSTSEVIIPGPTVDQISGAATAAQDAANSAAAALASQNAAQAAEIEFFSVYYGAFSVAPTHDPFGQARTIGDIYFDTVAVEFKVFDGSNWISGVNSSYLPKTGGQLTGALRILNNSVAFTADEALTVTGAAAIYNAATTGVLHLGNQTTTGTQRILVDGYWWDGSAWSIAMQILAEQGKMVLNSGTQGFKLLQNGSASTGVLITDTTGKLIWDNTSPRGGFRNYWHNGNFLVWQRGITFSSPASGAYVADRHFVSYDGTGAFTLARSGSAARVDSDTTNGYQLRWNQSTTITGGSFRQLVHRIEGVSKMAGKFVTISFKAWAASGTPAMSVTGRQVFGTGGSPSSNVAMTAKASFNINATAYTNYTAVFQVPSIVGKTLGTNGDDYLQFEFNYPTSGTFDIMLMDVQIEDGFIQTPFEQRDFEQELLICQRFYRRLSLNLNEVVGFGWAYATSTVEIGIPLRPQMRVAPTVAVSSVGSFQVNGFTATGIGASNDGVGTKDMATITGVTASSITAGNGGIIRCGAASQWIDFNSDL